MNRLALAAILVVVFGAGLLVGTRGRSVVDSAQGLVAAAGPTMTPTPRPMPPTPVPTPRPTAAPTATPIRDLVIEVAEADLNEQLQTMLVGQTLGTTPIGDATIRSVRVSLQDGQVLVGGGASVGPLNAPFAVAGSIAPDAVGYPRVTVNAAQVAGFALPAPIVAGMGQMIQQQIDQVFAQQTVRVRSVDIADGRIRIVAAPAS